MMDLSGIARYAELDEMLADPSIDMIDICLPPALHAEVAVAALKAGKHVFCEKPIALKPADAKRMVEAARTGRQAAVDRPRAAVLPRVPLRLRGDRQRQVRQAAGRALQADHLRSRCGCPTSTIPKVIGGPMLDLHIHDAHFIRLVCGMPRRCRAWARCAARWSSGSPRSSSSTIPALVVTAASGVIASRAAPSPTPTKSTSRRRRSCSISPAVDGRRRRDAVDRAVRQGKVAAAEAGLGRSDRLRSRPS